MPKDLAIVLNNGSVNSAVATALAAQRYRLVMVYSESATEGARRMRSAYEQQVAHFKPYREHTLSTPFLAGLAGAAPVSAEDVDPRTPVSITPTLLELVPLIGVAARLAVHYSATSIHFGLRVGSNADELAQATEFVQIWQEMLQMTCGQKELDLSVPLMELDAWQVVDLGFNVATPFDRTWSCLEDGPEPCWACRGCRAREIAFQRAAKPDPLKKIAK